MPHLPRARPWRHLPLALAGLLAVLLGPAPRGLAHGDQPTERWYERLVRGQKVGHVRVVWAPSTWQGRKTVRDTTTFVTATLRDMSGVKDVFETTVTVDLERSEDGVRWWQRTQVDEAGRTLVEELRWTGEAYEIESRIGEERAPLVRIALDAPVMTDAEAFLGPRLRAGDLAAGERLELRVLDVNARAARAHEVHVLGREAVPDETGQPVECVLVEEVEPRTGGRTRLWFDADGALVRLEGEGGSVIQRTTRAAAERMPARPAEFSITAPAQPRLERVFSADRLLVDLHVQGADGRSPPEFPDSPWSRVLGHTGDDAVGWTFALELRAYEGEGRAATFPVQDPAYARYLEPTALMQADHPLVRETAAEVVDGETDARKAALRLARFVYESLDKQSPAVAQADAVQILNEGCGDCSEHCLLFVTLCRAVGIPARRCSGYVLIGSMWGAHAWAEIWTGEWIGADPTTGEVGTGARYLFFGYPDGPDPYPGVTASRAEGRMRFVATRLEEGPAHYDLGDPLTYRRSDVARGRYLNVLTGVEAHDVPEGWSVVLDGGGGMNLTGDGLHAVVRASADQGMGPDTAGRQHGGRAVETTFGGAPALLLAQGSIRQYVVFSRRRIVQVIVLKGGPEQIARLEQVLGPTFRPEPLACWDDRPPAGPVPPGAPGKEGKDGAER